MKPKSSTRTRAVRSETQSVPPPDATPAVEVVSVAIRIACPACGNTTRTYCTHRQGAVVRRYHLCPQCGRNEKTMQAPDGSLRFEGYASTVAVQAVPPVASQIVPPVSSR